MNELTIDDIAVDVALDEIAQGLAYARMVEQRAVLANHHCEVWRDVVAERKCQEQIAIDRRKAKAEAKYRRYAIPHQLDERGARELDVIRNIPNFYSLPEGSVLKVLDSKPAAMFEDGVVVKVLKQKVVVKRLNTCAKGGVYRTVNDVIFARK